LCIGMSGLSICNKQLCWVRSQCVSNLHGELHVCYTVSRRRTVCVQQLLLLPLIVRWGTAELQC
jgi:hypothetical protein